MAGLITWTHFVVRGTLEQNGRGDGLVCSGPSFSPGYCFKTNVVWSKMDEGMVWYALVLHFHRDIALKPTLFGLVVRGCLDNAGQLNRVHRDIVVNYLQMLVFTGILL